MLIIPKNIKKNIEKRLTWGFSSNFSSLERPVRGLLNLLTDSRDANKATSDEENLTDRDTALWASQSEYFLLILFSCWYLRSPAHWGWGHYSRFLWRELSWPDAPNCDHKEDLGRKTCVTCSCLCTKSHLDWKVQFLLGMCGFVVRSPSHPSLLRVRGVMGGVQNYLSNPASCSASSLHRNSEQPRQHSSGPLTRSSTAAATHSQDVCLASFVGSLFRISRPPNDSLASVHCGSQTLICITPFKSIDPLMNGCLLSLLSQSCLYLSSVLSHLPVFCLNPSLSLFD